MKQKKKENSQMPQGPGVYWWHTAEDTFDKIDFDGLCGMGQWFVLSYADF